MEKIQRALATQGAAPLPAPELRFFTHRLDAGRALASPTPGAPGILELNLIYLEREPWESSRATVGHELAHLVVFHLHPHRRIPPRRPMATHHARLARPSAGAHSSLLQRGPSGPPSTPLALSLRLSGPRPFHRAPPSSGTRRRVPLPPLRGDAPLRRGSLGTLPRPFGWPLGAGSVSSRAPHGWEWQCRSHHGY